METKSEYIILNLDLTQNYTATAQQKGERVVGRYIQHYEKNKVSQLRHEYAVQIRKNMTEQKMNAPKLKGPVEMEVIYYYETKDKKKLQQFYKDTKPDEDNINKLLQDVLADFGFFAKGDGQVAKLIFTKCWDNKPHIYIKMKELRAST